mmetsp:Transcript_22751/g.27900  ORF Transcript_22751/g.27900 Transcript_22751/m.27900 type:complete len:135 (+) Transcript_22751:2330-2734(+)
MRWIKKIVFYFIFVNKHFIFIHQSHSTLVPEKISDEVAVFAEPLAAACRIVEQNLIRYDMPRPDKVAILGDGKLGLMIAEVLDREHTIRLGDYVDSCPMPIFFGKHKRKMDLVQKSANIDCRFISECKDKSYFS